MAKFSQSDDPLESNEARRLHAMPRIEPIYEEACGAPSPDSPRQSRAVDQPKLTPPSMATVWPVR
jgi:hypothetical protein